ncbi:hypothetical protein CTEN210_13590 [Chaetoceros tenuissimus]|uniref:Uncharacterized protein n=1 Tax=Chaetoceros tenuissimus TaxID=426638 RepID=A0AAD3D3M0_9STRA|nr:hypothetical protein CTEN210_13590 [Chaetoceros tenuissimus]
MYSRAQQNSIIFVPIIAGSLSSISSVALIASILRSKVKLHRAVRRIIFGFCTYDVVYSIALNLATFVAPKGEALYAIGNIGTCDAQGFFIYVGYLGSILYNVSLAMYYLCTIRFSLSERTFRERIEPFCHLISIVSSLAIAIFLLAKKSFNLDGRERFCYISATPKECLYNDDIQCERGSKMSLSYALWFSIIPFATVFIIILLSMFTIIIATVVRQKESSDRWCISKGSDDSDDSDYESCLMKVLTWCFGKKEQTGSSNHEARTDNPDIDISKAPNRPLIEKLDQKYQPKSLPTSSKNEILRTLPTTSKNERIHSLVASDAKQVRITQVSSGNHVSSLRSSGRSNASDPHAFDLKKMRASKVVVKKELTEEDSRKLAKSINSVHDGYDEELQILRTSQAIAKPKIAPSRSGTQEDPFKFDLKVVRQSIRRESLVTRLNEEITPKQGTSLRTLHRSTKKKASRPKKSIEERASLQCLLYISTFIFCYIVPVIQQFVMYNKEDQPIFALALIGVTTIPLQGFLMALVYTGPYVRSIKDSHPEYSWFKRFVEVIKSGGDQD